MTRHEPTGLFVGLCTLDVVQLVDHVPTTNEKMTARRQTVAAGGPATNAAVTFAHLGGAATLLTGVGRHPLATGIHADLDEHGVRVVDLAAARSTPPSVSSILVTAGTGERAVVSTNAIADRLVPWTEPGLTSPHADDAAGDDGPAGPEGRGSLVVGIDVARVDVVQIDGHHPELARAALMAARAAGVLTVLDGGSWKPGTEALLPLLDVVACSADFLPPGTADGAGHVDRYLRDRGVRWVAVTRGPDPVRWFAPDGRTGEVPVSPVPVVDTLGAGDVFHGALSHSLADHVGPLDTDRFTAALRHACMVAARSCASFGTRAWMSPQDEQLQL